MLFQLFALIFALVVSGRRDLAYNDIRMQLHERRRTSGSKWVPRRRTGSTEPVDAGQLDDLLSFKAEVEPAAWDHLVNPDANPASNAGDEDPEVAFALGDVLANLADKIQNMLANLDVDAIVAQIEGTIANLAEIIQNVADSVVEVTEAIVANIGNLQEAINTVKAAIEDAIAQIQAAAGGRRRQMTPDEEFFTKLDSLDGRQLNNVMDSDLVTIQKTNNFGPMEMQDLNDIQDHVGATAAALNLDANALQDLINNIQDQVNADQVQNAVATVLDQLANLQDVLGNVANAAALTTADLEVIATANMQDMEATGQLTVGELANLGDIQNVLNGQLADINLDALNGLSADAIANLGNLDIDAIQDKLANAANAVNIEDVIAQIQDKIPDANVAAALEEVANLKNALANLDVGALAADLQAVNVADLVQQADLAVLTDLEIAELGALQDVLAQIEDKVGDAVANLPDGLNIVNLEEIAGLAGAQLQMVTAELNLPNVDAAGIQNVLDDIAQINFDLEDLQAVINALQGAAGATAADLTFLQAKDTAPLQAHMEPQMAQMVTQYQTTLDELWAKGVDIDILPDGVNDNDLEKMNALPQASLNTVISQLGTNPTVYQLRTMIENAENAPAQNPNTTSRPRTTTAPPRNNGGSQKGGASMPRRPNNAQTPVDNNSMGNMPDMNGSTDMNGNMRGNGDMNGMNGGMDGMNGMNGKDMDGHDHTHEEPPIYSNPMVLGAVVVIVLGLGFLAWRKCANKPKQDEGLLASEVQRSNIPSYENQVAV